MRSMCLANFMVSGFSAIHDNSVDGLLSARSAKTKDEGVAKFRDSSGFNVCDFHRPLGLTDNF